MAKLAASEAATYISHQVFLISLRLLLFNEKLYNPTTKLPQCHQRSQATQTLHWPQNFHVQTHNALLLSSSNFGFSLWIVIHFLSMWF